MCTIVENRVNEAKYEIAEELLKTNVMSIDGVAAVTKLPIEIIEELAAKLKSAAT